MAFVGCSHRYDTHGLIWKAAIGGGNEGAGGCEKEHDECGAVSESLDAHNEMSFR